MINIPADTYEQHLTWWFEARLNQPFENEVDKAVCALLCRLSKSQMRDNDRGEDYPYIGNFSLTEDENALLVPYIESSNVQVRAYCKDVCHKRQEYPAKFKMAESASLDYLQLYTNLHHPGFLLRSVTVRSYKYLHNLTFVKELCEALSVAVFPHWMKQVCVELRKSYSVAELNPLCEMIKRKIESFKGSHREDERAYIDSLFELGVLSKSQMHYHLAISYEKEYDNNILNKEPNTICPKNVGIIQSAYNEICLVKKEHPADENRIRAKVIFERKDFHEKLLRYGPRIPYTIPQEQVATINELVQKADIQSAADALLFIRSIPFPVKSHIDEAFLSIVKQDPMSAYFGGERCGDKGQTLGKTEPDQFQRIDVYMHARLKYSYLIGSVLNKSIKGWECINEDELGQAICDACKSSIIETERIPIWARGIVAGLQGDYIVSVHLLIPQMERYLVRKAETLYGDLLALDNPVHQDEAGLTKALKLLKPKFKEDLFHDFWYFLNDASDVNLRNRVAHGLIAGEEIIRYAPYCLWLAVKMFFCEEEIFTQ